MNGKSAGTFASNPTIWSPLLFICGALFGWVALIVFLGSTAYENRLANSMRNWPTVQGTVIEAGRIVYSRRYRSNGKPHASVVIKYRYTVDGAQYVGNRYTLNNSLNPGDVPRPYPNQELGPEFAEGSPVAVHYNPSNPAESVLRPVEFHSRTGFAAFGVLLVASGWSFVAYRQVRKWQHARRRRGSL